MSETKLYKYPKTPYLPFSPSIAREDRIITDLSRLTSEYVEVTEKRDGENVTIYRDKWHCRSLDSKPQPYHSYLQNCIVSRILHQIPKSYRICGEYLYAEHSIHYSDLTDFFEVFSVWDGDKCLPTVEVMRICDYFGLQYVPEFYFGPYDPKLIMGIGEDVVKRGGEGIVVRVAGEFLYQDFEKCVAKYVRKDHVQEGPHWSLKEIKTNEIWHH